MASSLRFVEPNSVGRGWEPTRPSRGLPPMRTTERPTADVIKFSPRIEDTTAMETVRAHLGNLRRHEELGEPTAQLVDLPQDIQNQTDLIEKIRLAITHARLRNDVPISSEFDPREAVQEQPVRTVVVLNNHEISGVDVHKLDTLFPINEREFIDVIGVAEGYERIEALS